MTIRFYILILCLLAGHLNAIAGGSRSKVVDLGRIIYSNDESALLRKLQGFEGHTNVAVKIYTTFRLNKAFDIDIIYTTELSGDNSIAIVVQTGWWSTLTDDYEPGRYKDDLHIDRTENLNKQNLLPATMVEEIRKRMVNKFLNSTSNEQSKNLYYSLDYGVELLASLIYNPVAVKGSLIWESLWNRTDPYIMPEIAGFIDGCYNTYKSIPETDEAVEAATEVARDFAFNYALNTDGYRDAVNNLVTEALTDLDTYIKLANGIVAAEDKIVNIYKGTTQEDRYWRGVIVFEVASAIFPLTKTKTAAKSASGIRGLLEDLKKFKVGKLAITESTKVTIKTATKAITKSRLPEEFVSALKSFGKTEDDILEYFTRYHNDNQYRFLNEVEDLVSQYTTLTRAEAYTLWGYTTDNFYFKLNEWLRNGSNIDKTRQLKNILESALNKVPKYTGGEAYRAIGFKPENASDMADFLLKHNKGKIVDYNDFVSCGSSKEAAFYDKATKNIKITFKNLSPVADISDFADGIKFRGYTPKELLIEPGRKFRVLDVKPLPNNQYEIILTQI